MKNLSKAMLLLVAGLALLIASAASAQNYAPPAGSALDLAPGLLPAQTPTYTHYSTTFTGTGTPTTVTFLFRNDPGYTAFDDAGVHDLLFPLTNLLANPGFESGNLTGWTYLNNYGVSFAGVVCASCNSLSPRTGTYAWTDGATQGYDALSQVIPTISGHQYFIDFWQAWINTNNVAMTNFSQISTNGDTSDTFGNGIDTLVYVGAAPPPGIPEPATLLLLGSGLAGLAGLAWRKN